MSSSSSTTSTSSPSTSTSTEEVKTPSTTSTSTSSTSSSSSSSSSTGGSRVALVTGANKGIGLAIVDALAKKEPKLTILLGTRTRESGEAAIKKLNHPNVKLIVIDLVDTKTITQAAEDIKTQYGGLDILINNAGMAFPSERFDNEVVEVTINTNYYGTKRVCESMFPLLRRNARVVNVSSAVSRMTLRRMKSEYAASFLADDSTTDSIETLLTKFATDVKENKHIERGWPESAYGLSKVGVSALTRLQARTCKIPGVIISAVCPGWVATDMSKFKGTKTVQQGAETPVYAAYLPDGTASGQFYEDSKLSIYK